MNILDIPSSPSLLRSYPGIVTIFAFIDIPPRILCGSLYLNRRPMPTSEFYTHNSTLLSAEFQYRSVMQGMNAAEGLVPLKGPDLESSELGVLCFCCRPSGLCCP